MEHRVQAECIGDTVATLISESFDGQVFDTVIWIGGSKICTVSGTEKDKFIQELNDLIRKYRI